VHRGGARAVARVLQAWWSAVVAEMLSPVPAQPILTDTGFAGIDKALPTCFRDDSDVTQASLIGVRKKDQVARLGVHLVNGRTTIAEIDDVREQRIEVGQDANLVETLQHVA
jgi:hypothetical protein